MKLHQHVRAIYNSKLQTPFYSQQKRMNLRYLVQELHQFPTQRYNPIEKVDLIHLSPISYIILINRNYKTE